eukprot:268557-Alexandrium_andersonii.AAC.1
MHPETAQSHLALPNNSPRQPKTSHLPDTTTSRQGRRAKQDTWGLSRKRSACSCSQAVACTAAQCGLAVKLWFGTAAARLRAIDTV